MPPTDLKQVRVPSEQCVIEHSIKDWHGSDLHNTQRLAIRESILSSDSPIKSHARKNQAIAEQLDLAKQCGSMYLSTYSPRQWHSTLIWGGHLFFREDECDPIWEYSQELIDALPCYKARQVMHDLMTNGGVWYKVMYRHGVRIKKDQLQLMQLVLDTMITLLPDTFRMSLVLDEATFEVLRKKEVQLVQAHENKEDGDQRSHASSGKA